MPNVLQGLMQRLFGRAKPSMRRGPASEETVMTDLRSFIGREVAGGFNSPDQIAEAAVRCLISDGYGVIVRREAPRVVQEAVEAHRAAQATWPAVTDCDRLDYAFAALEEAGVISRQNFSCCGNCGSAEIRNEIDEAKRAGRPARGYAFFHEQDTESAVDGYGLHLNYGACENSAEADVALGHEVVRALEAKGLKTDWDGRIEKRIGVQLDWKRRTSFSEG